VEGHSPDRRRSRVQWRWTGAPLGLAAEGLGPGPAGASRHCRWL